MLRQRMADPFFNGSIAFEDDLPGDVAENIDKYLAQFDLKDEQRRQDDKQSEGA